MHVPATGFEHNLRWSSIWLASWWPSVWITTGLMKRSNKSRNGCHSPLDAKNWHVMNRLLSKPFTSSREIDSASCHTWWKTTGWCDVFGCRILFFKKRKYFFFFEKKLSECRGPFWQSFSTQNEWDKSVAPSSRRFLWSSPSSSCPADTSQSESRWREKMTDGPLLFLPTRLVLLLVSFRRPPLQKWINQLLR